MSDIEQKTKNLVINKLAEHIGVEADDINLDDFLDEDLHLNVAEISDFLQKLSEEGMEIEESKLENIDTVSDLIDEILSQHEVI